MAKKFNFIYKTTNLINGKIYVGYHCTDNLDDGYIGCGIYCTAHINDSMKGFHNAVRKYGYENFKREILEFCNNLDQLYQREIFWIKELESHISFEKGYNLALGGNGGDFGGGGSLKWTEEKKQYHRERGTYKKSRETRKKLSISTKKRFESIPGTFTGKTHSVEQREKWSKERLGKPSKCKGRTPYISEERRLQMKQPKSEELKKRIQRTLRQLTDEQIYYLETKFQNKRGEKSDLARKWGVSINQITGITGVSFSHKRKKDGN